MDFDKITFSCPSLPMSTTVDFKFSDQSRNTFSQTIGNLPYRLVANKKFMLRMGSVIEDVSIEEVHKLV